MLRGTGVRVAYLRTKAVLRTALQEAGGALSTDAPHYRALRA